MLCKTGVVTLVDKDYWRGFAALVNSLHAHKFRGTVWVGYRGKLPPWLSDRAGDVHIVPVLVTSDLHFASFKPHFLLQVFETFAPSSDGLFFLDADIVINRDWRFFEKWISGGVALCEDIVSPVYASGPRRTGWKEFCEKHGVKSANANDTYYNSGLIGIPRTHLSLLREWRLLLDGLHSETPIGATHTSVESAFFIPDQDLLNAVIDSGKYPVSAMGKEGMGFAPGEACLYHAIGNDKPWRKLRSRTALRYLSPVDLAFLRHGRDPLPAIPYGRFSLWNLYLRYKKIRQGLPV